MNDAADFAEMGISEHLFRFAEEQSKAAGKFPIIDASSNAKASSACLKTSGIHTVIRYYARDPAQAWKRLAKAEADAVIAAGLRLAIVHENDRNLSSFSYAAGLLDGEYACKYGGETIGQPNNSAIYYAVDFDYLPGSSVFAKHILPYFEGVTAAVNAAGSPYRIGVYGSGFTCKILLDNGLVSLAWLAQSTGWSGYQQFKASKRWALLQHAETTLCGIGIDYDEPNPEIPDFGSFGHLEAAPAVAARADDADVSESLRSSSALDGLDPDLKARLLILLQKCKEKGAKMVPYFGIRDPLTQAKLWRQSRSAAEAEAAAKSLESKGAPFLASVLRGAETSPGKHVTNALPGLSWHQWGEAVDCYWEVNGKPEWDPEKQVGGIKGFHVYADLAETSEVGLTPGGHWSSFKDWPHVQLRSAAGPQNVFSYAFIDATMKERFGGRSGGADERLFTANAVQSGAEIELAQAFRSALDALRDASNTTTDKRYFFPNGIFKIDVAIGIGGPPPSEAATSAPLAGARVTVSGIDKA
jgi:peptidoglycan L-alanyl-D-glutamate endopeptidase CwlK